MVITDDENDDDNDDVHDVKNDPIVDSRHRLEHNIMSSITVSRHNCEQGQPKPQLGGCTAHHNNRGGPPQAPPHRAGGGDTMGGGGGEGGVATCIIHTHTDTYIYIYISKRTLLCII